MVRYAGTTPCPAFGSAENAKRRSSERRITSWVCILQLDKIEIQEIIRFLATPYIGGGVGRGTDETPFHAEIRRRDARSAAASWCAGIRRCLLATLAMVTLRRCAGSGGMEPVSLLGARALSPRRAWPGLWRRAEPSGQAAKRCSRSNGSRWPGGAAAGLRQSVAGWRAVW
jgi:hypothetical protein